jgi:hypothetical protein
MTGGPLFCRSMTNNPSKTIAEAKVVTTTFERIDLSNTVGYEFNGGLNKSNSKTGIQTCLEAA